MGKDKEKQQIGFGAKMHKTRCASCEKEKIAALKALEIEKARLDSGINLKDVKF